MDDAILTPVLADSVPLIEGDQAWEVGYDGTGTTIAILDTTKRYEIVSRQSLDDAKVGAREGTSFRGPLEIADSEKFWSPSRYLIIVQR